MQAHIKYCLKNSMQIILQSNKPYTFFFFYYSITEFPCFEKRLGLTFRGVKSGLAELTGKKYTKAIKSCDLGATC